MEYMTYEEYLVNVKKGIVTDLGHCPVTPLLLMLQGKWKAQILYELCIHDTARFGLLKRMLKGITNASLTKALRELESDGLIKREQFNENRSNTRTKSQYARHERETYLWNNDFGSNPRTTQSERRAKRDRIGFFSIKS